MNVNGRRVGISHGAVLLALGGIPVAISSEPWVWALAAGAVLIAVGLAAPALLQPYAVLLRPCEQRLAGFAWVAIARILFHIVLTPIALVSRPLTKLRRGWIRPTRAGPNFTSRR